MQVAPLQGEVAKQTPQPEPAPLTTPAPTPQPEPAPMPVMFERPYTQGDKAVIGSFTEIGKDIHKVVYTYKVKEKGNNDLLFSRFQKFKPGSERENFIVLDESSSIVTETEEYRANQVLYVELLEEHPEMMPTKAPA